MSKEPIIIPIASGKGGVGKTLLSVNLGYALAQQGKETILIDLDFGGANIHTILGYESAPDGIGNFLNRKGADINEFIVTSSEKKLKIIPGDAEMVGIANLTGPQKKKLINNIYKLETDYVILDLGAGSSYNTIDFFMLSALGIIVAVPEITSILNAYAMLKNSIFRLLYMELRKHQEIGELFSKEVKRGGESAWKITELMDKIFDIDPELQAEAAAILDSFNPKLIINMATKPKDIEMGEKLRRISDNYLSIDLEYLGFLYNDNDVKSSITKREPLALYAPKNQTYQTIQRMAYKIINAKRLPYFLLDIDNYDDSLEILLDEATDDLSSRLDGYEQLADENLLTVNELLSIVKNLEYENINLKKQIKELEKTLLKYK